MNVTITDATPVAAPIRLVADSVISESLAAPVLTWGTQGKSSSPKGTLFEPPGPSRRAIERRVHSYGWRFTVAATSLAVSFQLTAPIASMIASQSQLIHALTILPSATWYHALAVACHFLPLGG